MTGGQGFLGRHLVAELERRGCGEVYTPSSEDWDLSQPGLPGALLDHFKPTIVLHLAARVGGIGINQKKPADFFYQNLMMGVPLFHESWRRGIEKFVSIGTVCSYPKHTPVPFSEDQIWNGYPEETNAPYGLAKKMLLVAGQAYRDQYDFSSIYLLPVNLYGPGDNFDPESSHVIPALIRKCFEAKLKGQDSLEVWGTGSPTREFLHVTDAARGIAMAAESYDKAAPVNLGSGQEVSIKELAELIQELTGFDGEIKWDASKPDGQPRRCLDVSRAKREFGFETQVSFREGLKETIEWFRTHERMFD